MAKTEMRGGKRRIGPLAATVACKVPTTPHLLTRIHAVRVGQRACARAPKSARASALPTSKPSTFVCALVLPGSTASLRLRRNVFVVERHFCHPIGDLLRELIGVAVIVMPAAPANHHIFERERPLVFHKMLNGFARNRNRHDGAEAPIFVFE